MWINGQKTAAVLSPYICQWGIWLRNQAGGDGGPHVELKVLPQDFAHILSADQQGTIELALAARMLGKIDECQGYAAVDAGPNTRLMEACQLSIRREGQGTRFEFEGRTGFLRESAVSMPVWHRRFIESQGIYQFRLWFLIPDDHTDLHVKDALVLQALKGYIARQAKT